VADTVTVGVAVGNTAIGVAVGAVPHAASNGMFKYTARSKSFILICLIGPGIFHHRLSGGELPRSSVPNNAQEFLSTGRSTSLYSLFAVGTEPRLQLTASGLGVRQCGGTVMQQRVGSEWEENTALSL